MISKLTIIFDNSAHHLLLIGIIIVFICINIINNQRHRWDEAVWAYISQQWIRGKVPYSVGTKDVKPPLTYLFGKSIFQIFPQRIRYFRLISFISYGLSSILVLIIIYNITSNQFIALFGATIYVINPLVVREHLTVRTESLSHVFSLAAIYTIMGGHFILSGLFCGLAILSKQSALVPLGAISAYLLYQTEWMGFILLPIFCAIPIAISMSYFRFMGRYDNYLSLVFKEVLRSTSHNPNRYHNLLSGFLYFRSLSVGIIIFFASSILKRDLNILVFFLAFYIFAFIIMSKESFFKHYLIDISGPASIGTALALQPVSEEILVITIFSLLTLNMPRYISYLGKSNPEGMMNIISRIQNSEFLIFRIFYGLLYPFGGLERLEEFATNQYSAKEEQIIANEMSKIIKDDIAFSNTAIWLFLLDIESGYDFPFYGLRSRNRGTIHEDVNYFIIDSRHGSPGTNTYPVPENAVEVFNEHGIKIYENNV